MNKEKEQEVEETGGTRTEKPSKEGRKRKAKANPVRRIRQEWIAHITIDQQIDAELDTFPLANKSMSQIRRAFFNFTNAKRTISQN